MGVSFLMPSSVLAEPTLSPRNIQCLPFGPTSMQGPFGGKPPEVSPSIRRIGALKALGDAWIKRKEQLSGSTIDLESTAFRHLFGFMLDTFRESMLQGNVPRDQAEAVFARLAERMNDDTWEQEARNKMKGA